MYSFTYFLFLLQVAELKRNLELEEMRKFRQMSRPSFDSTRSITTKDTTTTTDDETAIDDDDNDDEKEAFLDHYNEE